VLAKGPYCKLIKSWWQFHNLSKRQKGKSCPCVELSTTPWRCIGGVEVRLHAFLTSALDGGDWSASRPGRVILLLNCFLKYMSRTLEWSLSVLFSQNISIYLLVPVHATHFTHHILLDLIILLISKGTVKPLVTVCGHGRFITPHYP
jgi:hypothetical protein